MANVRLEATVGPRRCSITALDVPDGRVLYDGVCVLCPAWFRFVATRDPEAFFKFPSIQAAYGRQLAVRLRMDPDNPKTNAVVIRGTA